MQCTTPLIAKPACEIAAETHVESAEMLRCDAKLLAGAPAVVERPETETGRKPSVRQPAAIDGQPQAESRVAAEESSSAPALRIVISKDGPYLVSGGVPLVEQIITPVEGHMEYRMRRELAAAPTYALCRCGHTSTPPFCDGSHFAVGFKGDESAERKPYEDRADALPGMGVFLLDDNRCAFARFCHREDGDVWSMTERSGNPRIKGEAIRASSDCPAGRLVHIDTQDGTVYEPELAPRISVLQDAQKKVSGPLFVQGGVALISADGTMYEVRNRYALCRCGASNNKPFCDAMHVSVRYRDGSKR